ncbi:MAG TPA: branched-chain amino acid ABC transporter substrate-binding protein, partial [Flavobacteriaceae bacterium]|nr:branched-chain amino acid ABC transporter substrate-binding protein [Flavobacteriaceae bacterium]
MGLRKDDFIVGFALFALFFGVGNIVLPPMLGFLAGQEWYLVAIGFIITAIGIPLLGIFAHARIQG